MTDNYQISYITSSMSADPAGFVRECEANFRAEVSAAASLAVKNGSKLVMLAGPSSSGKTTTASILDEWITARGGEAYVVSLDDFYLNRGEGPKREDGTDDYETVYALDIPCITDRLYRLLKTGRALLPMFDFVTGRRSAQTHDIRLKKEDILVIEGLHALNPVITGGLPQDLLCLAYISVSSRVCAENNIYLNKRDLRFIRRLIRDYKYRNSSPERTFALWRGVLTGEDEYLFPFSDRAHIRINSFHPYEPCVFAHQAIALLDSVPEDSVYYKNARLLSQKLSGFAYAPENITPQDSLLREFLGK